VDLTVAVNAADTLFQVHWVPGQIMIEKYARELQVDIL